jgi:uncharacterized protein (TIGR03067 family)
MKKARYGKLLFSVLAFSIAVLVSGCASRPTPTPAATTSELQRLQGTWEGSMVGDQANQKIIITIAGDSLHFHRDPKFWFKTTFTLPTGTNPQELHATITDCAPPLDPVGKVVVAIFKIEGETMTLAAMGDDAAETPKTFEGGTRYDLRKVQPRKS